MYVLKQDFQHLTSTKQILTLKTGTKIDTKEGDFYIITKSRKKYQIHKDIVENNPDFFEKVDLKTQIQDILKKNNKRTAPKMADILHEFLSEEYLFNKEIVDIDQVEVMLEACRQQYIATEEDKWLLPISRLGWSVDGKGVFKE